MNLRHSVRLIPLVALLASTSVLTGCEEVIDFIDSISDGAECESDSECLGGRCLTATEGFPGGYCTTLSCDVDGCSNIFGSECLANVGGIDEAACFESCSEDVPCRDGYQCLTVDTAAVCLPGDLQQDFPASGTLGTACGNSAECESGFCATNLSGGYCTILNCDSDGDCGAGNRCLSQSDGSGDAGDTMCFRGCTNDNNCRFGYECTDVDGGGGACVPAAGGSSPVRNPGGAADGSPCTVDINCMGGTCMRAAEGFPGGYCTTLDCSSTGCNEPAGGAADCRVTAENTACFVSCGSDGDCRDGYQCTGADSGDGFCEPENVTTTPDPVDGGGSGIFASCNTSSISGGRALRFHVEPDSVAFAVVPYSNTDSISLSRLLLPGGSTGADFDAGYAFMNINSEILGNIAPVFFPAAPAFESIVEQGGGDYTLEIGTRDTGACFYVIQKDRIGTSIDLNFYFVGARGVSASTANASGDFQSMLNAFREIYSDADIELDEVRMIDVQGQALEDYRIIRDFYDINALVATSADPGPSLEEQLSVNVFLIQGFAIPQAPGLLGISTGIPGVPAAHGTSGSGLVFTSEYLADYPEMVGQTMAHEIGHFNGLRHTSEHGGSDWDPIDDTAECSNPDNGTSCPDARNFMFPFSLSDIDQTIVSPGQAFVLQRAPLVQ